MDTTKNTKANNNSDKASIGSAVHDIFQESGKRRIVIRKSSGETVIEMSVLLALILSIGAPVLPAFVILGVLLESIRVSFERTE